MSTVVTPAANIPAFNNMGRKIPTHPRQNGYDFLKEVGIQTDEAYQCVRAMSDLLERDNPFEAQATGMKHLDLTGTYRLMAILLTF